jgi:hypothetical protein
MPTEKKAAASAKARGSIPFHEFLVRRQDEKELKNSELAQMTGYGSANVIAMLRNGAMAFPLNKTGAFAKALGIDPVFMLQRVLESRNPELLEVLEEIIGNRMVTEAESDLLDLVRKELDGAELNLMAHPEFIETLRPALRKVADREKKLHEAAITAIKRDYKPGPRKAA